MSGTGKAELVLSTGSLYTLALDRVFELASATGYDGVELLVDWRLDSFEVPYLQRLSERWGIPISSVHTPFAERVDGWPETPEGRVERTVELTEQLRARTVVAHTPERWHVISLRSTFSQRVLRWVVPWPNGSGERYARWLQEELPALQRKTAVRIAVENMPARRVLGQRVAGYRFSRIEDLERWPYLVLDTTHWGTWGMDPNEAYKALRERIIHVHLSNYDGKEHRLPFSGRLKLEELLRRLREDAYSGIVAIELEPGAVGQGDWSDGHLREVLGEVAARCRGLLGLPASHSQSPCNTIALS